MSEPTDYLIGDLRVDLQHERVLREGREIPLARLSFALLRVLIRSAPELVSVEQLMEQVWPGLVVGPETVSQRVKLLREALADDPKQPRYISVARGRGYRLAAAATPITTSTAPRSIAVLPFVNLTTEPDKEYFGDGVAEELIHILSSVPGLQVPARTSSFSYKGRSVDVRQIARDLGVATLLEGSVRSAGERIRITAQLIDAQTGFHVWSQSYDRRFEDIFRLQDEIAGAILQALHIRPNDENAAPQLPEPPTPSAEAYQLYLQGHARRVRRSAEDIQTGIRFLERAIAIDPNFARAYADVAIAQIELVSMGRESVKLLAAAERHSRRALSLDPRLPQAYANLSYLSVYRARWLEADGFYRQALALNYSDPNLHFIGGQVLLPVVGHLQAALRACEQAYRLAPSMPIAAEGLALAHTLLGQEAPAARYLQLAVDLGMPRSRPPLPFIDAAVARASGRHADAADCMSSWLPPSIVEAGGPLVLRLIYAAMAGAADREQAIAALEQLCAGAAREAMANPIMRPVTTVWFSQLGALNRAYELAHAHLQPLEPAGVLPGAIGIGTYWLPEMGAFRQDPRFQGLVARLGLLQFWERHGPPDGFDLANGQLICTQA